MHKVFSYRKCKNEDLFRDFRLHGFTQMQNYIPIYKKIFSLTPKNYNSINLNHPWYLKSIIQNYDYNTFQCVVESSSSSKTRMKRDVFIKTAPLLDPFKFVVGNYESQMAELTNLPQLENEDKKIISKLNEETNTAYNDNLFYYLSCLLHSHGFVHGIEYFGSFLAIKKNFTFKIFNEIEHIYESPYFLSHLNELFEILDVDKYQQFCQIAEKEKAFLDNEDASTGGTKKPKMHILDLDPLDKREKKENDQVQIEDLNVVVDVDVDVDVDVYDEELGGAGGLSSSSFHLLLDEQEEAEEQEKKEKKKEEEDDEDDDFDSVSSRSSKSSQDEEDDEMDEEEEGEEAADEEEAEPSQKKKKNKIQPPPPSAEFDYDFAQDVEEIENMEQEYDVDAEEEEEEEEEEDEILQEIYENGIDTQINNFPTQLICIEKCKNTFDSLIIQEEIPEEQIVSAMIQIIFSLLLFQRIFQFTHNDLHTNNVMYIQTKKKYLVYHFEGKRYTVPTYGRIFKIIDFGRSIFTVEGSNFCSDSYKKGEDAYSQYNFGCYFNPAKPVVEPNYSFDLCRLACSMFDALIPDFDMIYRPERCTPLQQLIIRLCQDDKQRNIMYKRNQEERYPDFKLYKMIARTVHNHTPEQILQLPLFQEAFVGRPPVDKNTIEMNLDALLEKFQ